MHPDLEVLIAVQLRDTERARLTAELAEAPRRVLARKEALAKTEAAVTKFETALSTEETQRRRQESDIADRRARIARLTTQLGTATSTAQVAAWEHEIEFARGAISTLEDSELASLERSESLEAAVALAREARTAAASFLADARAHAATVLRDHTATVAVLDVEREELRGRIVDPAPLATYDRVSRARGTGVAEGMADGTNGQCSACHVRVRPQRWMELTDRSRHDDLFTCESCGRLLYWDPRRDAPIRWQPGELTNATPRNEAA